jgi:hypothetical protein
MEGDFHLLRSNYVLYADDLNLLGESKSKVKR